MKNKSLRNAVKDFTFNFVWSAVTQPVATSVRRCFNGLVVSRVYRSVRTATDDSLSASILHSTYVSMRIIKFQHEK